MSLNSDRQFLTEEKRDLSRKPKENKHVCLWSSLFFFIGAMLVFIPATIVIIQKVNCSDEPPTVDRLPWNSSDYSPNSDLYNAMNETHDFAQLDNLRLDRLSSPRLHPTNGQSVIYLRKQYHMPDLKGSTTTLHWLDLRTKKVVQLTQPIWGVNDQQFYWVNDKAVLFLSNRDPTGLNQLFQINLPDDLAVMANFLEPIQLTNFSLDIDNLLVNKQGTRLAFSCQVYANLTIEQTAEKQAADKASGSLVYKFDKLFIRHWDEYMLGPRHHPFVVSIKQNEKGIFNFSSKPRDVLFGVDSDSPTRPFGDGRTQWSFSASGNRFAFTRQHDETSAVSWSTNLDIFTVDLTVPESQPVCITTENKAADTDPRYSPVDENVIIYRAQAVPGYESDQFKIKLFNTSTSTLLDKWDASIQAITWAQDSKSLYLEVGEKAQNVIYKFSDITSPSSVPVRLVNVGSAHDVNIHPTNNDIFACSYDNVTQPTNIYLYSSASSFEPLTDHNQALMDKVRISKDVQLFTFKGAQGDDVWGWYIAPANGTANKAPLAFLIHGGPQSSWYNAWSFRWNYEVFAAAGYAVVAINFHGSDSYGQKFTDSITGNYGTLPYQDLQLGLTAILKEFPYIDPNRAAALGASYGGFMINWIAGHPEMSKRFQTLVCHDGLFDMRGMAYSTEELWFSEHDAGGVTPYDRPDAFELYNPVTHVANWSQPMLIIHGGRDYRVPDTQGIGAFTALQRRGIKSRLLYLPNENHWTLNVFNSLIWYDEVLGWIGSFTK